MKTSLHNPDNEPSRALPDSAAPAHLPQRAKESNGEAPPRGEVFDIELDSNGEAVTTSPSQKRAGAYFFAGLAVLFCTYNIGAYVGQKSKTPAPIGPFTSKIEKLAPLRLQIAGKVKKPGVYTLPGGSRIEDALKIAGGALPNSDLRGLNLADWAVDGSKIEVPARKAVSTIEISPTPVVVKEVFVTAPRNALGEAQTASELVGGAPKTASKPRTKPKSGKTSVAALLALRKSPIDLNRAGADQLALLPGVGPKMAERIVAYRRENGVFKSLADLDNVKGIGEKRMETLKNLVKVK